ncbi:glutamine amidotransferase [Lysobacteraceae bacterium NML07-0707]|nr:glutamine amidotransferase [Xanthomonadaceae bacterium NML07-0707]
MKTKTAIAIRHVHFEDLGSLEPLLTAHGYAVLYLDAAHRAAWSAGREAAENADLLIVLGGPVGAFDEATYPFLRNELALIEQRLLQRKPLLGICLGAQLIARALGAAVRPMPQKEIGFSPLRLTAAGKASPLAALGDVPVLNWHGDQFDLPQGATLLASTPACPHQAFSYGHQVLALQCHLEADPAHLEYWLLGHACELAQAGIDPHALRRQAAVCPGKLPQAALGVWQAWLQQIHPTPSGGSPGEGEP